MTRYANNEELNAQIIENINNIERKTLGSTNLIAMIKKTPTKILKADSSHLEQRYRPGSQLITYNEISEEGQLIKESWGEGIANILENSVILKNNSPLLYPAGHEFEGLEVKGTYDSKGNFIINQDKGTQIAYNEYVSDIDFVRGAYGVEATTQWKEAFKLQPSYVFEISRKLKEVIITSERGIEINLHGGDYVVIDTKKDEVTSVHGINASWLDKTYVNLESYLKTL